MGAYLDKLNQYATSIPVDSFTGFVLEEMNNQKWLTGPFETGEVKEKPEQVVRNIVIRVVTPYFIYYLSPFAIVLNVAVGLFHIYMGFAKRSETVSSTNDKKMEGIHVHIYKGVSHLLVACYDFGIRLISIHPLSVAFFTLFPSQFRTIHEIFFKKPQICPVLKTPLVKNISKNKDNAVPLSHPHLDSSCYLYTLADRIIQRVIPENSKKETSGATQEVTKETYESTPEKRNSKKRKRNSINPIDSFSGNWVDRDPSPASNE